MATQEPTVIENTTASTENEETEIIKDLVGIIDYLTGDQIDAILRDGDENNFFRLFVLDSFNDNNPERVYIGTERQDILYGPETLTVSGWESNCSVVIVVNSVILNEREMYMFSNIVIPGTLLRVTNQVRGGLSAMFGVRFETVGSNDLPYTQFFRDEDPNDNELLAYYTVRDGNRQYLRPVVAPVYDQNGHMIGSRRIIQAVQDNTSDGHYVFRMTQSNYTPRT